ncbi:MAG TPA: glycine cleavage system protein GcvH [Nevskiaceae bacterium]
MSKIPAELRYVKTHEWVRKLEDGTLVVGITDHAQESLGDLVFAEPPATGRDLAEGESCAVLESVKSASDIYAPVAGEVTEANAALGDKPELINEDPYGKGWLWKMRPADATAFERLLDAAGYEAAIAAE